MVPFCIFRIQAFRMSCEADDDDLEMVHSTELSTEMAQIIPR
jgi:hypothetical protein